MGLNNRIHKFEKLNEPQQEILELLFKLVKYVENREQYSVGHSERVAYYAKKIGKRLNLPPEKLDKLELAGYLHDVGKISISDVILQKTAPLTFEERLIIQQHPLTSCEILSPFNFLRPIIPAVKYHHERWDGSGYPEGLKEKEIPLEARILGIVDSFEALSSKRPYRNKFTIGKIFEIFEKNSGILFDPEITEIFIDIMKSDTITLYF
ncbi:HD-GYP domain-containing protein [Candidatus Aminicenantes bacterium AC-708-M15]|jgi:putative nucleotidyltransferase with HDIG domain|nr:HD-GYP domain-containing protein [SCandidatus Aminicenantes bacterium Aminicenantia_JdfR_composite]MCP2597892.1 HD-GYP domain-containing protein [Candidatus Aminicenantes bacterium AC-335-L06]MCP2604253.1 HD-GYP domain-containing protein [Candidatus Aminicenantes bacterium AC-708-M15]MCP2606586.1 HD-GYP domain-containing protein [Candidatus Aminicenantes bacterium AC-708-I09]MCP2618152.1 HD-GYP domain-containing protein [Candidatus Aminicenantes bacterium AC-335-A11]